MPDIILYIILSYYKMIHPDILTAVKQCRPIELEDPLSQYDPEYIHYTLHNDDSLKGLPIDLEVVELIILKKKSHELEQILNSMSDEDALTEDIENWILNKLSILSMRILLLSSENETDESKTDF